MANATPRSFRRKQQQAAFNELLHGTPTERKSPAPGKRVVRRSAPAPVEPAPFIEPPRQATEIPGLPRINGPYVPNGQGKKLLTKKGEVALSMPAGAFFALWEMVEARALERHRKYADRADMSFISDASTQACLEVRAAAHASHLFPTHPRATVNEPAKPKRSIKRSNPAPQPPRRTVRRKGASK